MARRRQSPPPRKTRHDFVSGYRIFGKERHEQLLACCKRSSDSQEENLIYMEKYRIVAENWVKENAQGWQARLGFDRRFEEDSLASFRKGWDSVRA